VSANDADASKHERQRQPIKASCKQQFQKLLDERNAQLWNRFKGKQDFVD
jgi:hypothetical protein